MTDFKTWHGEYVGEHIAWHGEKALLMKSETPGKVLAQFDNMTRFDGSCGEPRLAFGLHEFDEDDFEVDEQYRMPAKGTFLLRANVLFWSVVLGGLLWSVAAAVLKALS